MTTKPMIKVERQLIRMFALLKESQQYIGVDWAKRRDALVAEIEQGAQSIEDLLADAFKEGVKEGDYLGSELTELQRERKVSSEEIKERVDKLWKESDAYAQLEGPET